MELWKSRLENLEIMNELKNTYSGKRVFVTGHTGFKGSWLIKILSDFGAVIKGYAIAPENEINLYSELNGDSLCESVISNLIDREALKKAVLDFQPDYIFHLAAQPLVRLSYEIPSETFEVNAIGTANLLDAIRLLDKKCNVVLITTDKVYHNNEWEHPYRETDRLGGYDPYSASKACCELVIDSYKNSFFNTTKYNQHQKAIAVGRAGNVIGGGDWSADRLIPDAIRAFEAQQALMIRNPLATRPWQHVLEPLAGYLVLAQALYEQGPRFNGAWNFGPKPDDARTVEAVINAFVALWPHPAQWVQDPSEQPHEAQSLQLDCAKAQHELHWRPRWNLEEALMRIRDWHLAAARKADLRQLSLTQIAEYQSTHSLNSF